MSRRPACFSGLCVAVVGAVMLGGCTPTEADPVRSQDATPGESRPSPTAPIQHADDVQWTVQDSDAWPSDLVPAAKEYVASCSEFDRMTLFAPRLAETSDGATWTVFTVGVTDQPEYEHLVVVMKREPGHAWTGANAGTGMGRSEVLPEELSQERFGTPPLEDR